VQKEACLDDCYRANRCNIDLNAAVGGGSRILQRRLIGLFEGGGAVWDPFR